MQSWLEQRHYADLDPRAERALRSAGLSWHDETRDERGRGVHLARSCGALQAYGYVLLRCGEHERGMHALSKVVDLDRTDQTKTRVLVNVIRRSWTE